MSVTIDLAAGEVRLGDALLADVADASAVVPGALLVGGVGLVRPLGYATRANLCAWHATPAGLGRAVLDAASDGITHRTLLLEALALYLAGADAEGKMPGFSDVAFVMGRIFGWRPDQLADSPARWVDGLAASALPDGAEDGPGDGWTRYRADGPTGTPATERTHAGDRTPGAERTAATARTPADERPPAAEGIAAAESIEALRDRLARDLLRRANAPLAGEHVASGVRVASDAAMDPAVSAASPFASTGSDMGSTVAGASLFGDGHRSTSERDGASADASGSRRAGLPTSAAPHAAAGPASGSEHTDHPSWVPIRDHRDGAPRVPEAPAGSDPLHQREPIARGAGGPGGGPVVAAPRERGPIGARVAARAASEVVEYAESEYAAPFDRPWGAARPLRAPSARYAGGTTDPARPTDGSERHVARLPAPADPTAVQDLADGLAGALEDEADLRGILRW